MHAEPFAGLFCKTATLAKAVGVRPGSPTKSIRSAFADGVSAIFYELAGKIHSGNL
jgi:hypothetical protein